MVIAGGGATGCGDAGLDFLFRTRFCGVATAGALGIVTEVS